MLKELNFSKVTSTLQRHQSGTLAKGILYLLKVNNNLYRRRKHPRPVQPCRMRKKVLERRDSKSEETRIFKINWKVCCTLKLHLAMVLICSTVLAVDHSVDCGNLIILGKKSKKKSKSSSKIAVTSPTTVLIVLTTQELYITWSSTLASLLASTDNTTQNCTHIIDYNPLINWLLYSEMAGRMVICYI